MPRISTTHIKAGWSEKSLLNHLLPSVLTLSNHLRAHSWLIASKLNPANNNGIPPGPGTQLKRAAAIISSTPKTSVSILFQNFQVAMVSSIYSLAEVLTI